MHSKKGIVGSLFVAALMIAGAGFGASATTAEGQMSQQLRSTAGPSLQLAQGLTRQQRCTRQRQACAQGYLVNTTAGGKAVSPEGARICWAGYRSCMKRR